MNHSSFEYWPVIVNFRPLLGMVLDKTPEVYFYLKKHFLLLVTIYCFKLHLESYDYAEICFYGDKPPNTYFKVKALFFSFKIQIASLILQGNMHCSAVPIISNRALAINWDCSLSGRCSVYLYMHCLRTVLQMVTLTLKAVSSRSQIFRRVYCRSLIAVAWGTMVYSTIGFSFVLREIKWLNMSYKSMSHT